MVKKKVTTAIVSSQSPVAEKLGYDLVEFSKVMANTIYKIEGRGLPKFHIAISIGIGILSAIRRELNSDVK